MRLLAFLLLILSLPALAGDYVPLRERLMPAELEAIGLSDAQVEQLDAALRAAEARERKQATQQTLMAPAPRVNAETGSSGGSALQGANTTSEPSDRALKGAPTEQSSQPRVGLGDAPIVARAVGRIASWAPGTVFTLDNGQRWQVLKGSVTLRTPLDSPRVRVVPGFSGRWFLEVTEEMPKARVFLLD